MKRILLVISIISVFTAAALAQKPSTSGNIAASNQSSVQKKGRQVNFRSGTQLAALLENTLDVRRAKPGDHVVLKTIADVKQDGLVVIRKGSLLLGHVSEVQQQTKSDGESRLGLVFDRLRSGSTEIAIAASVLSITQANNSSRTKKGRAEDDTMAQSSTNART